MNKEIKVAVIGGTGKSGKFLVRKLIEQGFHLKVLVRNPDNFKLKNPLVEIIIGNVLDYNAVCSLIEGCQAIISTLGLGIPASEPTVFSRATTNIVRAMNEQNIYRYIVTTGLNVDAPFDNKSPETLYATQWMREHFPVSTADKQLEFDILSNSNVSWTLVRLPLIEQTDKEGEIVVSLDDCYGDKISAADLAVFLIEQLFADTFVGKSPFIASV